MAGLLHCATMPDSQSPRDRRRWLLGFGLAVLLAANLCLVAVLAASAWSLYAEPKGGILIGPKVAEDLSRALDLYRDRVDSLIKLVTALIGLSALYSTVIGITAYLNWTGLGSTSIMCSGRTRTTSPR